MPRSPAPHRGSTPDLRPVGGVRATVRRMVVDDLSAALELAISGANVVVILPEGVECDELPQGSGRLAVLVGDPGDATSRAAAAAMDAELFPDRD